MTHFKFSARYAALVLGVVVASSCDTRLPTQVTSSSDDVERPQVSFTVAGAVNNAVTLGVPVVVTVKATDNKGVSTVLTTVRNGAIIIGLDTVTLKPVAATTTRNVTVPLTGARKGGQDRRAHHGDGRGAQHADRLDRAVDRFHRERGERIPRTTGPEAADPAT